MNAPTQDQLKSILESAILAPSADNHHRVRFEWGGGVLNVRHAAGPLPPAEGYKRVLSLLSLGALSENLTLAAGRFGIKAEPELSPDSTNSDLAFQVRWQPGDVTTDPLREAIPKRHTNRHLIFHGPTLSVEEQTSLGQAASGLPDCSLVWLDGRPLRRQALRLMRLAEGERFRNRLLHEELFSAIRFDVGWRQSCEEGLPPGALEIERPLRSVFALLHHWPVMRVVNMLGGHRLLGLRAADLPCRFSPHLGLIAVERVIDQTIFNAGRSFERVWLTATQLGFALQPMPAAALYALKGAQQEGISGVLQQRLQQGWQAIVPGQQPLMLFRIGRAAPSALRTGRKPLEHYISRG